MSQYLCSAASPWAEARLVFRRRWGRTRAAVALGCGLTWLASAAAPPQITQVERQADGFRLVWTTEPGQTYEVLSAASVTGPWGERETLVAGGESLSWKDTGILGQPLRFYRVTLRPDAAVGPMLLAAASLPSHLWTTGLESANVGSRAVFLASFLGAGSQRLVTTGTLTEEVPNWSYTATPTDRLQVEYRSGTNLTYWVTRMEGDFTGDAANFLESPHHFQYRVVQPGVGDLEITSIMPSGSCEFVGTAQGSLVWSNVAYAVAVTQRGSYCVDVSFGYELQNDVTTTGTITAPGYSLDVRHRWRHHLIGGGGGNASSVEEWNSSTLTVGADTFRWEDTKRQKSFRDGKPSSLDDYWLASGRVLRNGADYGVYRTVSQAHLGLIKFVLELPNQVVDLEVWNVVL